MAESKASGSFTKLPNKIFELGLDPFEICAFAALASHGGENAQGIFPSLIRLTELTGMSRRKLWDALDVLSRCNVIQWERGKKGVANTYYILGIGAWSRKRVDKSGGSSGKPGGGSARGALPVVHEAHQGSARGALPVVHEAHPNQIQLNQIQLTKGGASQIFGDNFGANPLGPDPVRDELWAENEKRRQLRELAAATAKRMP